MLINHVNYHQSAYFDASTSEAALQNI